MNCEMMHDSVWRQQQKYEEAEAFYQAFLAGTLNSPSKEESQTSQVPKGNKDRASPQSTIKNEIAQARQHIQNVLKSGSSGTAGTPDSSMVTKRLETLEKENKDLRTVVDDMKSLVRKLESRVEALEKGGATKSSSPAEVSASAQTPKPTAQADSDSDSDSDDDDLFGDETEEAKAEREKRKAQLLEEYQRKKQSKPALIAKSSILLDVKPWDDETDMKEIENFVRSIEMDGLLWGAAKLIPVGYGIKKLQINCVVEDDKVGTDDLEEAITVKDDLIQSVDIAAFNKI